jgi:hypothetical protein
MPMTSLELYLIFAWAAWLSYFTVIYPLAGRWHFTLTQMLDILKIFGED